VVGFDAVLLRTSSAFCASGIRLRNSRPLLWNQFLVVGWLSVLPLWCFLLGVCGLSNISERGRSRSRQRRTRKRSESRSQSGFLRLFYWLGVISIGGLSLGGETAFYVRFGRERERVRDSVCVCLFKLCFWDVLFFGGFGFYLLEKEEELVRSSEQGILGSCCVGDLWTVVSEPCVCWSLVGFGLILDACGTFDRWQVPGHDDEGADYVCRSESVNPGPWGGGGGGTPSD
jgi:hypothetical protein